MNDIEVTSIDLVEGGNVFKQGHYLTLGYVPRDEKGETVDLSGKTLNVALWSRKGVAFEAAATFSGGVIRFTLDKVVAAGDYTVEFTATSSTDAKYRKKFPTNQHSGRIAIKQSADDLGVVGIQVYTVAQLKAELKTEQTAALGAAVSGFTVDSETKMARVSGSTTYASLPARLEADKQETAILLADKASKSETRMKSELIQPEDASARFLEFAGGGSISLLSEPRKGSVSAEKTTFLEIGKNKFNKKTVTPNHYVAASTGVLISATGFDTSDFIETSPGAAWKRIQSNYIAFYDIDRKYVSGASASGLTFIVPANAYYFRVTVSSSAVATEQIELGTVSTAYEDYKETLRDTVKLSPNSVGLTDTQTQLFEVFKGSGNLIENSLDADMLAQSVTKGLATLTTISANEAVTGMGIEKVIRVDYPSSVTANDIVAYNRFIPLSEIGSVGETLQAGAHVKVNTNPMPNRFTVLLGFYNNSQVWISGVQKSVDATGDFVNATVSGVVPTNTAFVRVIIGNPVNNPSPMQIDFFGMYIKKGISKALLYLNEKEKGTNGDNPREGLSMIILGDSITKMANGWVAEMSRILKPRSVVNVAVDGARWCDYASTTAYDGNPQPGGNQGNVIGNQVQKILNTNPAAPDIIIISASTNDDKPPVENDIESQFTNSASYIPLSSVDRKTFAGAMRYAVETLRNKYPNAQIFIATPIQRAENSRLHLDTKAKADVVTAVTNRLSATPIDAFNKSGIYAAYESIGVNGKYLADGLHPNTFLIGSAVPGSLDGGTKLGRFYAKELLREIEIV